MTAALTRLRGPKRVRWTTVLGLLLVPLTVAGVLLWGLWNPTERLGAVTAAVVNEDEPVEVNGQLAPLGRLLAGELVGGGGGESGRADGEDRAGFTWVLTDAEDAKAGLREGAYATVITIPEDFSAAATSLSGDPDEARTARIDIAESDRGRLIDTALSSIVTRTATDVLNQQLGEQFVGNVYVGMNRLGEGVGQAADGAAGLAEGGRQLQGGAQQLADGTAQLSSGTQQLAGGAGELSSGAAGLATGASQLAGGLRAFATGQPGQPGLNELATNVEAYTNGVNQAISGLQQGAGSAVAPLQQLYAAIEADLVPLPEGQDKQQTLAGLAQLIGSLQAASADSPDNRLTQLKNGGAQLTQGARAAATGADQLAGGAEQLASGASQLSTGASELSSGASQLAGSTPALAEGASQLASGAGRSADGAASLASGLDEAAAGIPATTEAQRDRIASTAVRPVEASGGGDELFSASGVPLFAGVALWAGALAAFLLLAPLWRRTRDAARGVLAIALRSALPALALGAAQGAIAGVALPIALGYGLGQGAAFFGIAVLAGVAFALVVQGLSALLGGLGRFVAFALLVVAFAVGIVSTVPAPLAAVGDASPIGAAFAGFQSVAMGASGAGGAAVLLALWGLGGLALTVLAVSRARSDAGARS